MDNAPVMGHIEMISGIKKKTNRIFSRLRLPLKQHEKKPLVELPSPSKPPSGAPSSVAEQVEPPEAGPATSPERTASIPSVASLVTSPESSVTNSPEIPIEGASSVAQSPAVAPAVSAAGKAVAVPLTASARRDIRGEATTNNDTTAEEKDNLPPVLEADRSPDAASSSQVPTSKEAGFQARRDAMDATVHDHIDQNADLPPPPPTPNSAGAINSNAANGIPIRSDSRPPKTLKKAQEEWIKALWSLALEHLEEKLSIEESAVWLEANGDFARPLNFNNNTDLRELMRTSLARFVAQVVRRTATKFEYASLGPYPPMKHDEAEKGEQGAKYYSNEYGSGEDSGDPSESNIWGTLTQDHVRSWNQARMQMRTKHPKQAMVTALDEYPYASILWAFSYITLMCLSKVQPLENEDGYVQILSVLGRTEGYVSMPWLTLRVRQTIPGSFAKLSADSLVALYESILMFHVRAVMQVHKYKQDSSHPISLQEQINEIAACEGKFIASLDQLGIQIHASALLTATLTEAEKEEIRLREQLAKLYVSDQKPLLQAGAKNSDILDRFFALAFRAETYTDFIQWRVYEQCNPAQDRRILWVRGSPGVGKSMLLRAIRQRFRHPGNTSTLEEGETTSVVGPAPHHVVFFSRDDSGQRRNGDADFALHAVEGLIHNLLLSQSHLMGHFEDIMSEKYACRDDSIRDEFDSPGDFVAMSTLLYRIVQAESFEPTCFVLDGIDQELNATRDEHQQQLKFPVNEESDLQKLLVLMATTIKLSSRVKWILSADRHRWATCSEAMAVYAANMPFQELDLDEDFNSETFVDITRAYAADRVVEVCRDASTSGLDNEQVRKSLLEVIQTTRPTNFLWANMALLEISRAPIPPWELARALCRLATDNPTVEGLYATALSAAFDRGTRRGDFLVMDSSAICSDVLAIAAAAYQPLTVSELAALSDLPPAVELPVLVKTLLPTFLVILNDGTVHFTNPSAQDYVKQNVRNPPFATNSSIHTEMTRRCLILVLDKINCHCGYQTLRQDHHGSVHGVSYSIYMWIKHLLSEPGGIGVRGIYALIVHLLNVHLVEWLALLGPTRNVTLRVLYLMRRLHATALADACTEPQQLPQNGRLYRGGHDVPTVGSDTAAQVIREVIVVMQRHQQRPLKLKGQKQITPLKSVTSVTSDLDNWLLFAANLPHLRRSLVPSQFPCLAMPPPIDATDASTSCLHVITHREWVRTCCFSPDGRLVASGSDDRCVRLWNAQTGNLQQCFYAFDASATKANDYVRGVAMAQRAVAAGAADGTGEADSGTTLLVAFSNTTIRAWDVISGKLLLSMNDEDNLMTSIALSPRGDMLAVATRKGLLVWEDLLARCPLASEDATCYDKTFTEWVTFSPDGNFIASCDRLRIRIWNTRGSSKRPVWTLPTLRKASNRARKDDQQDGSDKEDGTQQEMQGKELGQTSIETAEETRQDGQDGEGRSEDSDEYEEREDETPRGHTNIVNGFAFSPDSQFLVSGANDHTTRVWDLHTGDVVAILKYQNDYVNCVAFSPDGMCIATATYDCSINIWKQRSPGRWASGDDVVHNGNEIRARRTPEWRTKPDYILRGHVYDIFSLAFTPVLSSSSTALRPPTYLLASSSIDKQLRIWDVDINIGTNDAVEAVDAIDSAAGMKDTADTETTTVTHQMPPQLLQHEKKVCCVAISPNGSSLVVTASTDGLLCFWDGATGEQIGHVDEQRGHASEVLLMTFSLDGVLLVTSDDMNIVLVWNMPSQLSRDALGKPQQQQLLTSLVPRLRLVHNDWVRSAAFSLENDRLVATACYDGTARVFDISGAKTPRYGGDNEEEEESCPTIVLPRNAFRSNNKNICLRCVAISNDGTRLAAGGDDGCLRIWRLDGNSCSSSTPTNVGGVGDGEGDGGLDIPEYISHRTRLSIQGVAFTDDSNRVVSVSSGGQVAVWTWGCSEATTPPSTAAATVKATTPPGPPLLQCKIIRKNWQGYRGVPFQNMRFDLQFPGLVFTEHGPFYLDLEGPDVSKDEDSGEDSDGDSDEDASRKKKEKEAVALSGPAAQWFLPRGGLYNDERSIMWHDNVIALPDHFKIAKKPFAWCVSSGLLVMGGATGWVLQFRFKQDASPRRRTTPADQVVVRKV